VFATHDAADGPLARVRLPGGAVSAATLRVLADCAEEFGDGDVHVTSRGNVQLRAVSRPGLATRLAGAGLLPSPDHERVRNIIASPLSGVRGGLADIRGLAADLDAAICARPRLAELPGRFLFAFDDGRGDVAGEGADVCWRAVSHDTGALLLAGKDTGSRVPRERAVHALSTTACRFAEVRGAAWRISELEQPEALVTGPRETPREWPVRAEIPAGLIERDGGGYALGVAPPFGQLTAHELRELARLAPRAVVTPWRTLVLIGVDPGTRIALPTEPSGISACIGHPGCAKSRADVRADARGFSQGKVHFAGCERRCGKPAGPHADVVAEGGGYRVDGVWVPLEELTAALAQKGVQ
jgi:precorrin-3B synthase